MYKIQKLSAGKQMIFLTSFYL